MRSIVRGKATKDVMIPSFMKMGLDLTMLAIESQQVIAMRLARLAMGGPSATREANRMVSEKAMAAVEAGLHLASGGAPHKVVGSYRRKVRANRDRLYSKMVAPG